MPRKLLRLSPLLLLVLPVGAIGYFLLHGNVAVLNPQGRIAQQESSLIATTLLLSLIVVVPVFVMTTVIVWRYRAGNTKARYMPDWGHDRIVESIWWGVPCLIILVLAVIAWQSSHALDPFRALDSHKKPVSIQVVALQWKWLFIYPEQHIATVNFVQMPVDRPIDFEITADAPMNSFWIPQLGGQIYAMSGMSTHLHLIADQPGEYRGSSANISGKGFAGMRFVAKATTEADFKKWITSVQETKPMLDRTTYDRLALPSENNKPAYYGSSELGLYDTIMMKYMMPEHNHQMTNGGER